MRALLVAALLAIAPSAFAQDATRWMVEDATSTRFVDAEDKGPEFGEGDKVTLLFTEGDQVRVRRGDRYGWVAATAITDEAPARPADLPAVDAPTVPAGEFDLGALEELLQRTDQQ